MNIKKYYTIFNAGNGRILSLVEDFFKIKGISPEMYEGKGDSYLYVKGDIPILLVAHGDTVHKSPPTKLLYDESNKVLWSPDGLGADDRAGIIAIMELFNQGYRPHILITEGEEIGGLGADAASINLSPEINYMIEIDRRGNNQAVFYKSAKCKDFVEYCLSFGWKQQEGTFSDISVLTPAWGIASVNVSAGYYNEHSREEYLCVSELENTIDTVKKMLDSVDTSQIFTYEEPKHNIAVYDYNCDSLTIQVDYDELAEFFGMTPEYWKGVIAENYIDIQETLIDSLYEYIESYQPGAEDYYRYL